MCKRLSGTVLAVLLVFGGLSGCSLEGREAVDGCPELVAYDVTRQVDSLVSDGFDAIDERHDSAEEEIPRVEPACIEVNPPEVNFGGKKCGEEAPQEVRIRSCNETPLEIYGIRVKEGSSPDFGVVLTNYNGEELLDHEPTEEDPVVIPNGSEVSIIVTFIPHDFNELDDNSNVILDEGDLVITTNSSQTNKEIHLSGASFCMECATAVIKCAEGDEVVPQTVLHLSGDESYPGCFEIEKWEWSVEQPVGSQSVFVPSHTVPNPTFEANVAGSYLFVLDVWDGGGVRSCIPAAYEVLVIPCEAIHIELLWNTPEDTDESDTGPEVGSDLDLHFLHPWASGPDLDLDGEPDGWFDNLFDCFWHRPHPNWGSYDPAINDDPGLDRDDTDGAGPENVNLDIPEENVTYRVGVHYFNDHGYGPSYATVRVYIYAYLVFEAPEVMLVDKDMWEVCTVDWPSGKVLPVVADDGSNKITPQYENPYFFQD